VLERPQCRCRNDGDNWEETCVNEKIHVIHAAQHASMPGVWGQRYKGDSAADAEDDVATRRRTSLIYVDDDRRVSEQRNSRRDQRMRNNDDVSKLFRRYYLWAGDAPRDRSRIVIITAGQHQQLQCISSRSSSCSCSVQLWCCSSRTCHRIIMGARRNFCRKGQNLPSLFPFHPSPPLFPFFLSSLPSHYLFCPTLSTFLFLLHCEAALKLS